MSCTKVILDRNDKDFPIRCLSTLDTTIGHAKHITWLLLDFPLPSFIYYLFIRISIDALVRYIYLIDACLAIRMAGSP